MKVDDQDMRSGYRVHIEKKTYGGLPGSRFQGVFEQRFVNLGQMGQGPSQVLELHLSETSRG